MNFERLLLIAGVLFYSCLCKCTHDISVNGQYKHYAGSTYFREWKGHCVSIKAMVLTGEFLAAQKLVNRGIKKVTPDVWNTVVKQNKNDSLFSFKLRVEPLEKCVDKSYTQNSDVVYGFGRSDEERAMEITSYNFKMSQRIWLNLNGEKLNPEFCHVENSFGMDNGRDLWVAFKNRKLQLGANGGGTVSLFVQDPVPGMGVATLVWSANILRMIL